MPALSTTIRLFVCSPYDDMQQERFLLHYKVFPALEEYCREQGAELLVEDLRWGLSEERWKDQSTFDFALQRIQTAYQSPLPPHFLVLAGQKYGWKPLLTHLPEHEFFELQAFMSAEDRSTLLQWYRCDHNALPPTYLLQPFPSTMDEDEKQQLARTLRNILQSAVKDAGWEADEGRWEKFFASALEQECGFGFFRPPGWEAEEVTRQRVFCCLRDFETLPDKYPNSLFRDWDEQNQQWDEKAAQSQEKLRHSLNRWLGGLESGRVYRYDASWNVDEQEQEHIQWDKDAFAETVLESLKQVVQPQLESLEQPSQWELEAEVQHALTQQLSQHFVGHQKDLQELVSRCLRPQGKVIALSGGEGGGKTALLARLTRELRENHPNLQVISRFLGQTPLSSRLPALLEGLLEELRNLYKVPLSMPVEFDDRKQAFQGFLHLAHKDKPLVVLLDGVEALLDAEAENLSQWIPSNLPPHVQLILTLPRAWKKELPFSEGVDLQPFGESEAQSLLTSWLEDYQRTLQPEQRLHLIEQCKRLGWSPLSLKLGAVSGRHWTSFETDWEQPFVSSLEEQAERWFEALETRFGQEKMELAWGLWLCSRSGLSEEEWWLAILAASASTPVEQAMEPWDTILWEQFLSELRPWISEQSWQHITLLRLNSEPLKKWAKQRYLQTKRHFFTQHLVNFFERQHEQEDGKEQYSLRYSSEMPWLLMHAEQWESLESLLTNFHFLYQKCSHGLMEELQEDYLESLPRLQARDRFALQEWEEFFRHQHAVLKRGDLRWPTEKILLQRAIEYADRSEVTEAAERWLKKTNHNEFWWRRVRRVRERARNLCTGTQQVGQDAVEEVALLRAGSYLLRLESKPTLLLFDILDREVAASLEHSSPVVGMEVSPSKTRLATWCERQNELYLWDLQKFELLARWEGHEDFIRGVTWLKDGSLVSYSGDATLRLWQEGTDAPLFVCRGHSESINGVLELGDGSLLSWADDGMMHHWSRASGSSVGIFMGHSGRISGALQLSSQSWLSWSSEKGGDEAEMFLWDAQLSFPMSTLSGHQSPPQTVILHGESQLLSWSSPRTPDESAELFLWDAQSGNLRQTFEGHSSEVRGVQSLQDGTLLTWDRVGNLYFWSEEKGELLRKLEGHTREVRGIQELEDGRLLSWSNDRTLRVWDLDAQQSTVLGGHSGHVLGAVEGLRQELISWDSKGQFRFWNLPPRVKRDLVSSLDGHQDEITALTKFSKHELLTASRDASIRLWDVRNGETVARFDGHTAPVQGVLALSEERFVSWSEDHSLCLWNRKKVGPIARLQEHEGALTQVDSLDSGAVVSASEDGKLIVWNPKKPDEPVLLQGHREAIRGFRETADDHLISWGDDCTLRVWEPHKGEWLRTLGFGHRGALRGIRALRDGRLLSWSTDGSLHLGHPSLKTPPIHLQGHETSILGSEILSDGTICSWAAHDSQIRLWESRKGALDGVLDGHEEAVLGVLELPNGRLLSWAEDKTLRLWDPLWKKAVATLKGHEGSIRGAVALGMNHILSWAEDKTLRLWSMQTHRCEKIIPVALCPTQVILRSEHDWILHWEGRNVFARLNGETGQLLKAYKGHRKPVCGILPLEDGRLLSWSEDSLLAVWDTDSGQVESWLQEHTDAVRGAIQLSPNRVLSWSDDTTLRVWDLRMSHCLVILDEHIDPVAEVQTLSNGHLLSWSVGEENTIHLWGMRTLEHVAGHTLGHFRPVGGTLLLGEDEVLSWETHGSLLRRWNWRTGKQLCMYKGHTSWVEGVVELRNGNLLSWGVDGTLRHWERETGECLQLMQGHFSSLEGVWELAHKQLLTWNQQHFHRWDLESGRLLETYNENEVYQKRFPWLMAREFSQEAQATTHGFLGMARASSYGLLPSRLVWDENNVLWWHSDTKAEHHRLFANGILAAQLSEGQIAFLQLYQGRTPLDLEEFERRLRALKEERNHPA